MKKFIQKMSQGLEWIGGLMILLMTVVVLLQVIMRYIFNSPLTWTEEFARYLFVYITFLGAALLIYERGHLYVEIIFNNLPIRIRKILQLILDVIILGFSVFLTISAKASMDVAEGSFSTAMHIPMNYIGFSVLLGALLIILFSLWNIVQDVKGAFSRGGED